MPKVQTVTGPSVQASSVGNVSQRIDSRGAAGEAIGRSLTDISKTAGDIALDMKKRDDAATVKQTMSQFRKDMNKRQYEDDDAYFSRQGESAYRTIADHQIELENIRKRYLKDLNQSQKEAFTSLSQQYLDSEFEQMSKHALKGRASWLNQQDEALVEQSQQDGSLRWSDNAHYSRQIKASIDNLGERNGWPPEKRESEKIKALSAMHKTSIDNIIQQAPEQAEVYFAEHKDEIHPSLHDDIKEAIKDQNDKVWSMNKANEIRQNGGSSADRKRLVDEIDDPDRKKLVSEQVKADLAWEKRSQQEQQLDAYNRASLAIEQGESATFWSMKNPEEWKMMTPGQRSALSGSNRKQSDLNAYYEMKGLMVRDRDAAREYLTQNVSFFSHSDAKSFIDELSKPPKKAGNFLSDKAAFDRTMEQLIGKQPTKGGSRKEWNKRYDIMAGMYQQELDEWFEANPGKKAIDSASREQILDRLLISQTKENDWWWDEEVDLATIPEEDLDQIVDALRADGTEVSPENIIKLYLYMSQ